MTPEEQRFEGLKIRTKDVVKKAFDSLKEAYGDYGRTLELAKELGIDIDINTGKPKE